MLFEELAVVVEQRGDCILCKDAVPYLLLHESEVLRNPLLYDRLISESVLGILCAYEVSNIYCEITYGKTIIEG